MAEAPPPPSNLTYNQFLKWRTSNGIRGTRDDLSSAWEEYKHTPVISVVKSPIRSPKRSPVRIYGGLSRAMLTGLPIDVANIITKSMPRSGVRSMAVASKQTGRMVASRKEELCNEPMSQEEIISGLDSLPLPIGVGFSESITTDWNLWRSALYIVDRDEKGVFFLNMRIGGWKVYSKWKIPIRGYTESIIKNLGAKKGRQLFVKLAPQSLLDMHKRRMSCLSIPNYLKDRRKDVQELFLLMAWTETQFFRPPNSQEIVQGMIEGKRPITDAAIPPFDIANNVGHVILSILAKRIEESLYKLAWICVDKTLANDLIDILIRNNNNDIIMMRNLLIDCVTRLHQAYMRL